MLVPCFSVKNFLSKNGFDGKFTTSPTTYSGRLPRIYQILLKAQDPKYKRQTNIWELDIKMSLIFSWVQFMVSEKSGDIPLNLLLSRTYVTSRFVFNLYGSIQCLGAHSML